MMITVVNLLTLLRSSTCGHNRYFFVHENPMCFLQDWKTNKQKTFSGMQETISLLPKHGNEQSRLKVGFIFVEPLWGCSRVNIPEESLGAVLG